MTDTPMRGELPEKLTLTVPEVAALLGVCTWTIYEAIRRGDFPIPVIRVGRKILFATSVVDRLLAPSNGETIQ